MKIGVVLTKEQQDRIYDNSKVKELSQIMQNKPELDQETGSYSYEGIEFATEDESYEAMEENEL